MSDARDAATALVARGARAALVTGGHLEGHDEVIDTLYDGTSVREFRGAREHATGTHGTGCTLSSAIAALMARGMELGCACKAAQAFVAAAIANSRDLRVGQGRGPVHQLGTLWRTLDEARPGLRDARE
jgi:hydroxymethylpyrimidine/phosphomethylpyrimidine kinase